MNGSTFHISPIEAKRTRVDRPMLTLIHGIADDATEASGAVRPAHPGQEDFTPNGDAGDTAPPAVQFSEPGSPAVRQASRGNDLPDAGRTPDPGSGPVIPRDVLVQRLTEFLASIDEPAGPDARIFQIG